VGASYGVYSLAIAAKFSLVKVYAFEPEAQAHKLLLKNLELNKTQNVYPQKFALGDSNGTAYLYTAESANVGTHSLARRKDYPVSKKGKLISIKTGDFVIESKEADCPTVIKIDVEGAEYTVLKGLRQTLLNSKVRILQIEIHPKILPHFNATKEDIFKLLESVNYKVIFQKERGTETEVVFEKYK
jgi:FkbM family methyltransferase